MRLKPPPIEIPSTDPFRNDVLERRPMIEELSRLTLSATAPFVLCVDAPWGTGKTTFLRMWEAYIATSSARALYFNAWATDFASDPLVAFVGELTELAKSMNPSPTATRSLQTLKKLGGHIAKRAIPVAAKIATGGILDIDKTLEDAAEDVAAKLAEDAIEAYESSKKAIADFRGELCKLINALSNGKEARLMILVDELDRCRPDYALALLERVKHVFDVENVVFVLGLDRRQLEASVEAVYGPRIDSREYLRRFIDVEFTLPDPKPERFTDALFRRFEFDTIFVRRQHPEFQYDRNHLVATFNQLSKLFRLTLRAREQCFSTLRVALLSTADNSYIYPDVLVALVVLRVAARDAYDKFIGLGSVSDVLRCFSAQPGGDTFLASEEGTLLEAFLIAAKHSAGGHNAVGPEFGEHKRIANSQTPLTSEGEKKKFERAQRIIAHIGEMHRRQGQVPVLSMLISRIELTPENN